MSRYPKIPRQITLPFGYKICIRKLGDKRLTKMMGFPSHGGWVINPRRKLAPGLVQGDLFINKDKDYPTQLETLTHELIHAINDWSVWVEQAYIEPFQIELGAQMLDDKEMEG